MKKLGVGFVTRKLGLTLKPVRLYAILFKELNLLSLRRSDHIIYF